MYPQFIPGQQVRTCYGTIRTVLFQRGCQVFLMKGEGTDGWYHPTKIFAI